MNLTEPHAGMSNRPRGWAQAKDLSMRYYPAALALSLLAAVTASASLSAPIGPLDPRAAALVEEGRAALARGDNARATDFLEAALAVQPGSSAIVLDLAEAARQRGMPGEALHYYRVVLANEPQNINALAGEGTALAEMGALDKARRDLAQLQGMCGQDCSAAQALAAAIARGPKPQVAVIVPPKPVTNSN